jgi:hypothetical protein
MDPDVTRAAFVTTVLAGIAGCQGHGATPATTRADAPTEQPVDLAATFSRDAGADALQGTATGGEGELREVSFLQAMPVNDPFGVGGFATGPLSYCAIQVDGTVWCWDDVRAGATAWATVPPSTVQLAAGGCAACSRTKDGAVTCWRPDQPGSVAHVVGGVSGAIDLAVGGFSNALGCADGFAATANRHVVIWLDDGASGVVSDVSFSSPIRRITADSFMSFCVLLDSSVVDCTWNTNPNPRADLQPEGTPPGSGPVPYLRGARDIFMSGLCVYGLFPNDRVRKECVGVRAQRDGRPQLLFAASRTETRMSAAWWERASLGHGPLKPLEPRCVLRSDGAVECRGDERSAAAIVRRPGT